MTPQDPTHHNPPTHNHPHPGTHTPHHPSSGYPPVRSHSTFGRAVANCAEGVRLGLAHMDAAVGGCGGCPFAPGAAGNLATADLLEWLNLAGVSHSVNAAELGRAQTTLEAALGRPLKGPAVAA